ncbi:MAG: 5-guanidino-2-oxopentanoate decarboxylase [Pseudomonadota bacterium]
MSERPLGAQISHMLRDRGVTHIFGIPGVHNQEMYRGIEEAGLTHILARHEQGAGFMADGYARATGRPGVCYVITGPGLCNVMTPLGQAYSDSVPVLCISSCLDETAATKGQLHQMKDQRAAAETVCDWSETALSAEAGYALIDRALFEFEAKRPRSKHVSFPIKLLQADAPGPQTKTPVPSHDEMSPKIATTLAEDLNAARRPLFILGGGCVDDADQTLRDVIRRSGAACFTTYAGRGVIDADAPLYFGSYLARPGSAEVAAQADLIIAVGTEMAEVDLWRDTLGHSAPMWRVDIDPGVLARQTHPEDVALNVSAASFFDALDTKLTAQLNSDWTMAEVAATRAKWRAQVMAERPGIVPVADALREALPPKTMIYSDMTQFAYAAKEVWDMDAPGHWHHPTGFGTLGYALPASIGGAVARPGKPTICIIGDYGFQYTMAELATAVELKLPLPIVLWDNGKLGEIEDSMVRAQIAPNAVVQQNPDFLKLAEAFGAYAAGPESLTEFQKAVKIALAADRPTLIRITPELA